MLTVLMSREQSRDLRRHISSFAYHVTSLWRPPSCFPAMLFCIDTTTRRHCRARSKVKVYRPFALIQLPVKVRVSNPNERSKFTELLYSYNYQLGLGLGLVTVILSSVVKPNMNPDPNPRRTCRKNGCDDSGGLV